MRLFLFPTVLYNQKAGMSLVRTEVNPMEEAPKALFRHTGFVMGGMPKGLLDTTLLTSKL